MRLPAGIARPSCAVGWLASPGFVGKPLPVASPARSGSSSGASSGALGGDIGPAAIKGAILIFIALLLGAFLLMNGTDANLESASAPAGDDADPDTDTPAATDDDSTDGTSATTEATTTTAPAEARPPEEVTVLVANASGIPGAATQIGDDLSAVGYLVADPDNAKEPASTSTVYYIGDFEPEAIAVAEALGLDPTTEGVIAEAPTPLPTQDENLGAASILVILGTDLAPVS